LVADPLETDLRLETRPKDWNWATICREFKISRKKLEKVWAQLLNLARKNGQVKRAGKRTMD